MCKIPRPVRPAFPDWLEECRIPENLLADSYEKCDPLIRALIKTAISLAHFHFSDKATYQINELYNQDHGFWISSSSRPADTCFLLLSPDCDAAALVCALAILPVICDVPFIYAICIQKPGLPQILGTLQLCGIEDIFCVDFATVSQLIALPQFMAGRNKNANPFRFLLLDANFDEPFLSALINGFDTPSVYLQQKAVIHMDEPKLIEPGLLDLLLGSNHLVKNNPASCDVIYSRQDNCSGLNSVAAPPLVLAPECAGFWLFPELTPDFFRVSGYHFSLKSSF